MIMFGSDDPRKPPQELYLLAREAGYSPVDVDNAWPDCEPLEGFADDAERREAWGAKTLVHLISHDEDTTKWTRLVGYALRQAASDG